MTNIAKIQLKKIRRQPRPAEIADLLESEDRQGRCLSPAELDSVLIDIELGVIDEKPLPVMVEI